MNVGQYFEDNALHQIIKRHTATKRDPSFYSWYERDPATLFQIEKRTGRVGSNVDLATRAAKFKQFYKGRYRCTTKLFNVQGFWEYDNTLHCRLIRILFHEDQPQEEKNNYVRPHYYSLTFPDQHPDSNLNQATIDEVIKHTQYDSFHDSIQYCKEVTVEEKAAIKIQKRIRGNMVRKRQRNTYKQSDFVKISEQQTEVDRAAIKIQRIIRHNLARKIRNSKKDKIMKNNVTNGLVQTWQYKNKGVTETGADDLKFLRKKRMADQARDRWKNAKFLFSTTAKVGRFQKLILVKKNEKDDNIYYQTKFDKIPHVSTTRTLPSSRRWEWEQSLKKEGPNDPYLVFSDYQIQNYQPDDIAPVSRRDATPVNKSRFQLSTTSNVSKGTFGEQPALSSNFSRSVLLQRQQKITMFKPETSTTRLF